MQFRNIGVMSPGSMGCAIAQQLQGIGFCVYTALDERSPRTKALAREAKLIDVGSLEALAVHCDAILSIMNPGAALGFSTELARALRATQRTPLVVDCNALAPVTMAAIDKTITATGARCVDGSVMSAPPRGGVKGRLFVSGPDARALEALATPDMSVHVLSERIGDASALKMCEAVLSKGVTALVLQMLITARRLGIEDAVEAHFGPARQSICDIVRAQLPVMPSKSYRWVPEVLEMAKMFESVGLSPAMLEGAADIYEAIARTPLGQETPENRDPTLNGRDVVRLLAAESLRGARS